MSIDACFWALLSSDNFEFIHVPELEKDLYGKSPQDILLSQSLLNFIHPDEIPLTKADLLSFMKIKSLAGAVTRCRLCKILTSEKCQPEQQWIMTDIIIYGIAGKTLLAFFHNTATNEDKCSRNKEAHCQDPKRLLQLIDTHSLPITLDNLLRPFQIYDNSNQLLASWPHALNHDLLFQSQKDIHHPLYSKDVRKRFIENASGAALSEIKNGHRSSRFGCSYHTYSNSTATTLEPYGLCDIEKIIIHFGSIRFLSFQITPSESSYQKSNLERLPSIRELFSDTIPIQLDQVKQLPPITCLDKDIKPISTKPWQSRYSVLDKKCEHCHTCESPEWRKGPSGHKTLCNACGLRYSRLVAKHERQNPKDKPIYVSSPYKKKKLL